MEVITYKKQTSNTKYIIEAALEYRPPLNISRDFFSEKKINLAASIQENMVLYGNKNFDNNINRSILTITIKFIKNTERFDQPLF